MILFKEEFYSDLTSEGNHIFGIFSIEVAPNQTAEVCSYDPHFSIWGRTPPEML